MVQRKIENATFEELGRDTSARFQPLDAQLAAALIKTLPEQLRVRVQAKEMEAYKNDAAITGRQIVHMIYDWFRTDAHMSAFFSFHDLSQLTWLGDNPADMDNSCRTGITFSNTRSARCLRAVYETCSFGRWRNLRRCAKVSLITVESSAKARGPRLIPWITFAGASRDTLSIRGMNRVCKTASRRICTINRRRCRTAPLHPRGAAEGESQGAARQRQRRGCKTKKW